MLKLGATETRNDSTNLRTIIEIDEVTKGFDKTIGGVTIQLRSVDKELMDAIDSGVRRVVNKYSKQLK